MRRRNPIANQIVVAGVGKSEIGRNTGRSEGSLTLEATMRALRDAGMKPEEVDGVCAYPDRVSTPFEGPSITYVQRALGLPRTNFWQALGTGPAQLSAVAMAAYVIAGGGADTVVCYRGHLRQEQRYYVPGGAVDRYAKDDLAFRAPYGAPAGAPRMALWATRHMHEYGTTPDDLGAVVLTCREHAQLNPAAAWYGHPLTMEDYYASPMISTPLRMLDCDYPVDGAVAIVLTRADRASSLPHGPVYINSMGHATGPDLDWDNWPDLTYMGSRFVGEQLWAGTDLRPEDVDVAEVYDGFSILAINWVEDMGFCEKGEGGRFFSDGRAQLGGQLPVCTDGGQLGGGRLHGFGKLAQAVLQLRGECDQAQVPGAEVAVACAGGGPVAAGFLLTRSIR
jgi:acetyl-CoA acetyltransferase